jgi:hypothetical protein
VAFVLMPATSPVVVPPLLESAVVVPPLLAPPRVDSASEGLPQAPSAQLRMAANRSGTWLRADGLRARDKGGSRLPGRRRSKFGSKQCARGAGRSALVAGSSVSSARSGTRNPPTAPEAKGEPLPPVALPPSRLGSRCAPSTVRLVLKRLPGRRTVPST